MYDNEMGTYFPLAELDDGQWFLDDAGFLYINPAGAPQGEDYGSTDMYGPDNERMAALLAACRTSADGFIDDAQADVIGLTFVPRILHRFGPEDGYYTA